MSTRVITDGSAFKEDTLASSSYTTVPGVSEITHPEDVDWHETEATGLDDTEENMVTSIGKAREVKIKFFWDPSSATQVKLFTKSLLKTTAIYKIVSVDSTPVTHTMTLMIIKMGGLVYSPKGVATKEITFRLKSAITVS